MSPGKISEKVVTDEELYAICGEEIEDVLQIAYCLRDWMADHPEMVDRTL